MRTPVKVSVLTAAVALSFSCSLLRGRSSRAVLDPAPLQQLLDEAVAHPHRVGVSAAIGRCGELEWSGAAGSAGPDTPMTPATASRIGSISKLMTMVAFMRLRDRGHIALDTPVGALLPELPDTLRPITARQIMAHRSGVRHYKDREFWRNTAYRTSQEALPIFQDDPLLFPPGTGQSYSTYAFTLLS
ncbi:MAG: serine hydrolase domain-containing protein, partial [Myxococcota bacterium]